MSDPIITVDPVLPAAPSTADFAAALNDKDDTTAAAPRLDLPPPLLHHDSGIESTLPTPAAPPSIPTPPLKAPLRLNVVSPPADADGPAALVTATGAAEKKKVRHEDYDEEAYLASIDLDAIPSPVVLGGGPATTMGEAASARAEEGMRTLTLASGGGMIPVEAKMHFPGGPTAGPYRTWRQQRAVEARAREREGKMLRGAGVAAGGEKKKRWWR